MARFPLILHWSPAALHDLQRFADFLVESHPRLAARVAAELLAKSAVIADQPLIGRVVDAAPGYRELFVKVLNAQYVLRYEVVDARVNVIAVFHGKERRGGSTTG